MIDEERPPPADLDHQQADSYVYDFFKFQTQLSLLTLAAVFAVSQLDGALEQVGKIASLWVMGLLAAAGVVSFMGASEVVRTKSAGLPTGRKVALFGKLAPAFYALGVGGFLMMYVDVLT